MAKAVAFRNVVNKMGIDDYSESESSAIIKERCSIYGADKLLALKENVERDFYSSYRNYEKKENFRISGEN
jgi:hypothetical protein